MGREEGRREIAALFPQYRSGDRTVLSSLVLSVRDELRRAARKLDSRSEDPARAPTSPMALYTRVVRDSGLPVPGDPAFLAVCASAMRRAVVDYMGEDGVRDGLTGIELIRGVDLGLDSLERMNERLARVMECRYFAGLTEEETAAALGIEVPTVTREWIRARAWLLMGLRATAGAQRHPAPVPNAAWIDAVFDDALALPPGRLEAFLERCSEAPGELRARVEELLQCSSATVPRLEPGDLSPEFLLSVLKAGVAEEDPPPALRAAVPSPFQWRRALVAVPGSSAWGIIRQLHHGRLGRLYLAERRDRPSWPKGALRFVPGETNLAAFRRRPDWRILSSLTHAGIARLMEAGKAEDGRLFIVSEFFEGSALVQYCDEKLLAIEGRLLLFLKVCRAVQYGHRKLAVHGGLSPSNVIVTADGEVKLLDFGVAGLLATGEAEGSEPGTDPHRPPVLASPEQLRGEAPGVSSDVYQLGLLLYILLTGAQPPAIPVRPSLAVGRAAQDGVPRRAGRPGALARKLRGDLDAIVMHALRREPERRYPSVSLLRGDIHRYLECRPVWAQGDRLSYRVRKFFVRRSVPIAAAVILVTVGVVALPGAIRERLGASGEPARVADVEQLLGGMVPPSATAASNVFHVEQAGRVARVELAGDPASQSRVFTKLGRAYNALGSYERSIAILEEALALRRAATGDDSLEVAETLEALGESRHRIGQYAESESDLRAALAIREVRAGSTHPETHSTNVALGDLLYSRGEFLEAERSLRGVVDALRPEMVRSSPGATVRELLPRALVTLGNVLGDRGALGEAAVLYREAISALEENAAAPEQAASARARFSRALIRRAELDRAERELEQALATLRRAYPDEHPALALALGDYGSLRLEQGRLDRAHEVLTEALAMQERWLGRMDPELPRTRGLLAELAHRGGESAEAIALGTAALKDFERLGMDDHPWTVDIRATLADALIVLNRTDEALRVLRPALTSAPRVFVSYDARLTRLHAALARASKRGHSP